ncbi:MAG: PDZ domain-containing protein [Phycisphaerae bacterium]|nr:PDZ domain-containing protein [Phycisphaerae bacterium]
MPTRNLIFLAVLAAIAGGSVVAFHWVQSRQQRRLVELSENYAEIHSQLIQAGSDIRALRGVVAQSDGPLTAVDIARRLEKGMPQYELTDAERQRVLEGGLQGEVDVLRQITGDKYLRYVPQSRREAFTERIGGTGRGLGLRFELGDDGARITDVLVGSPADAAGLRAGDRIVAIDEQPVAAMDASAARSALHGRVGRSAVLEVIPVETPNGNPKRLDLTGRRFEVGTVEGLYRHGDGRWHYRLPDAAWKYRPEDEASGGLHYLRVSELTSQTHRQLRRAIRRMGRPQGLILDLRDNPGGQPQPAAEVANLFVSAGLLFRTVSIFDGEASEKSFAAHAEGTYGPEMRMVVLTNGQTASAAEIVAGTLRAHGRAVLVGGRTYGKPWVQSIMPVGELGLIIHSTGWYFLGRPSDVPPAARRRSEYITPDVAVQARTFDEGETGKLLHARLRARMRAMPRPWRDALADDTDAARWEESPVVQWLWLDAPLAAAVEMLKSPKRYEAILTQRPDWFRTPTTDTANGD